MISPDGIRGYRGACFMRNDHCLYVPPHPLLRPYISNYTFSFPTQKTMPDAYTVLPTASATLAASFDGMNMISRLRGVNTKPCNVGAHANKMKMLALVEFRPGGLRPFLPVDPRETLDRYIALDALDPALAQKVENALFDMASVQTLIFALDELFLARLRGRKPDALVGGILREISTRRGEATVRELAEDACYSEKHVRRLFMRDVGTGPKTFSRIVRLNRALSFLRERPANLADLAARAGYFDQPHFIREFREFCGLNPREYMENMSVFYNDRLKL